MRIVQNIYMLVSKDRKMIAKGTPSKRYICLIDEGGNKRYLTYKSEQMCIGAYNTSGYYLSDKVKEYIKNKYPDRVSKDGWVYWENIKDMFEVKKYIQETTLIN